MASGWNNGNLIIDPGAVVDAFNSIRQNGTVRATFGYQQSSSSAKLSFGDFGTNDTVIFDATGGRYKGYASDTPAPAGFIGEVIESVVPSASAVTVLTATQTNITSISLTPGIWDVSLMGAYRAAAITGGTSNLGISLVSATRGTAGISEAVSPLVPTSSTNLALSVPSYVISLSATTTVYMVAWTIYTAGTQQAFGRLTAKRIA